MFTTTLIPKLAMAAGSCDQNNPCIEFLKPLISGQVPDILFAVKRCVFEFCFHFSTRDVFSLYNSPIVSINAVF